MIPHSQTLVNSIVQVPANSTYTFYGVSASHFLSRNSNGKIDGSLLALHQCCVDFYIFTDPAWYKWIANGYNASNSTNSPVFSVGSSAIDPNNGVSAQFTFVPNPSETYELVFFNANRSLWYSNSTEVFHVLAIVTLHYSVAPGKLLVYPGIGLLAVAGVLIFAGSRYRK